MSSYPFFQCTLCKTRVQLAIECTPGTLPAQVVGDRRMKLSSEFDNGDFSKHCRGQGARYNQQRKLPYSQQTLHFNFAGKFHGLCCFCALNNGFGTELFITAACFNCARKEALRAEFARLYKIRSACKWALLPAGILDKIIQAFLGLSVVDGRVNEL